LQLGQAHLLDVEKFLLPSYEIKDEEVESEVNRFNAALKLTIEEIEEIKEKQGNQHQMKQGQFLMFT